MFASGSFFALIVIPSARLAISRTMSATSRSPWPGSRSRMNQAFSAKRQASRKSGTPCAVADGADGAEVLERDRLPAAGVVRDRDHHDRDVLGAARRDEPLERLDVHVALERVLRRRVVPLGDHEVDRLGARELDVRARRVEVGVVGDDLARAADRREEDLLGGAALVRRDHVLEGEELADGLEEDVPGRRAGVALVAVLDRRPLVA